MDNKVVHTISTRGLLKTVAFFMLLFFLYYIRDIVLLLFVAFIFSSLIDPFAAQLQKRKIPRSLAVIIIYFIIFGLVSLIFTLLSPVITQDLPIFIENIQYLISDIQQHDKVLQINEIFKQFGLDFYASSPVNGQNANQAISKIFSNITNIFEYIFSFGIVLVVTFYLVVQDDSLKKFFRSVVPANYVPYMTQLFKKIKDKLGSWMRGQMILSLIIGLVVFTGLSILNVRHAAVLSILAALMEFIPYIGPSLAAAPAMLIAFTQGGLLKMFFVLLMYLILQQLENHLLVPKVMQKAVGLNPIVSIFAILIGAKLAGPIGVLLAIPTATVVSIFMQDVFREKM
jgi:predicted PurR-regulated permease PerM